MRRAPALSMLAPLLAGCGPACSKTKPTEAATETTAAVDDRNTQTRPGDGLPQNAIRAAKRTASMVELQQLALFISQLELTNGRMPDAAEIRDELKTGGRAILTRIDEGAIVLTGTAQRSGLWAYEVDADKIGGLVLVSGTPSRATADEVKKLLGR